YSAETPLPQGWHTAAASPVCAENSGVANHQSPGCDRRANGYTALHPSALSSRVSPVRENRASYRSAQRVRRTRLAQIAASADLSDQSTGTRRNRSQWWARPSTCRCPAPLALPSSLYRISSRRLLWGPRQRIGYFHIRHAQLVKSVLQKILFRCSQVAF